MKKKFTMLLATFLTFVGVAMAGVTDLPQMSKEGDIKWYTIRNTRSTSGQYLYWTESGVKDSNTRTGASFFYVTGSADACYIHNYATELLFSGNGAWTAEGVACKLSASSHGTGLLIAFNSTYLNEQNYDDAYTTYWDVNDLGSIFVFEEVTDFSAIIDVPAAKATAKATLEDLALIPVFTAAATEAIAEVDAVEAEGTGLAELNAAVEEINAIVAASKKESLEGKFFTLYTAGRSQYAKMTATGTAAAATATTPDFIWQFVENNGAYNIYNPYTDKYLGALGNVGGPSIAVTANQAEAGAYNIAVVKDGEDAKVTFGINGAYIHLNGSLLPWYGDGGASYWTIAEVANFTEMVAAYKESSIKTLDSWATLSLVFDAALIEKAKTSINAINTSDYATFAAIDAELKKVMADVEAKTFTFQTTATDSHRENVWVSANMNTNKAIGLHGESDYNSIWGLRHAGGVAFYLYNELNSVYMGAPSGNCALTADPVAAYTFEIIDAKESIVEMHVGGETLHASNHDDDKLMNYDGDQAASRWIISTIDVAADIQTLLNGLTEDDYADVPALGQYPTAAYDALVEARTSAKTVEEVEHAIAAFKASLNQPVYFISSAYNTGYPAGSAIYYDGANWKWKKTNKFDRQAWMVIPGYTNEDVPAVDAYDASNPSYGICDYLTGTKMRGKDVQIVAIPGWGKAFNLQYNADGTSTDAAQHADQYNKIVNWKAATMNDCQASAWQVEYIGNTYDLDQLTTERLEALTALQAAYDEKVHLYWADFGDGLGQYQGDEDAIMNLIGESVSLLGVKLNMLTEANCTATNEEITNMATSLSTQTITINQPQSGTYFRIKGANEGAAYYLTGKTIADGSRIMLQETADASTVFYYNEGKLQAVESGLYVGLNSANYTFQILAKNAPAYTFEGSPRLAGAYNIKSDRYLHYDANGVDRCQNDGDHIAHDWYLEEVTETNDIPVNNNLLTSTGDLDENASYRIYGDRGFIYVADDGNMKSTYTVATTYSPVNDKHHFAFVEKGDKLYLYNVGAKKFVAKSGNGVTLTDYPEQAIVVAAATDQSTDYDWTISVNEKLINLSNGSGHTYGVLTNYDTEDAGNRFAICKVGEFNPAEALAVRKVTVTYNLSAQTITKENIVKAGDTFTLNPYAFATINSCKLGETDLEAGEGGTYSFTVDGDATVTVEITESLPFVAAKNVSSISASDWYYLQMHSNQKKYIQYLSDTTYIEWVDTEVKKDSLATYSWAFVGNIVEGFKMVNYAATKDSAVVSTGSGNPDMAAFAAGTAFVLSTSNTGQEGGFCMKYPNGKCLNAQSGKVAHWDSNDAGSTFVATQSPAALLANLTDLIAYAKTVETIESLSEEAKTALTTAITAAETAVAAATAYDVVYGQLTALNTAIDNAIKSVVNARLFRLKNTASSLYMTIVTPEQTAAGIQITAKAESAAKQAFYIEHTGTVGKYNIKSTEDYYLSATTPWHYGAYTTANEDGRAHEVVYLGEGKYALKTLKGFAGPNKGVTAENSPLYSNHTADNNGREWELEEVAKSSITYIYKYGEKEITREAYENVYEGLACPAATTTLPFGFSYDAASLPTIKGVGDEEEVIACELSLPFEYYDAFDNVEKWYYLRMHAESQNFLYYEEGATSLDATKTEVNAADKDAYTWAFVGDPINGFSVVNKKAGETFVLSSAVEPTADKEYPKMALVDTITTGNKVWDLYTSTSTDVENGFFMAYDGTTKRLNKQDGKVCYWLSGADNGSTFIVQERDLSGVSELQEYVNEVTPLLEALGDGTATAVGYITVESWNEAKTALETANKAIENKEGIDVAQVALQNAVKNLKTIQPTEGTYYTIQNSYSKVYMNVSGDTGMKTTDSAGIGELFQFVPVADGKFYMYNIERGTYLSTAKAHNGGQNQAGAVEQTSAVAVTITNLGAENHVSIVPVDGAPLHHDANYSTVVAWNGGLNSRSSWQIVEVPTHTDLTRSVTVNQYGYSTLYLNYPVVVPDIEGEGNGVFVASLVDGEILHMRRVGAGSTLPAKTGVVVKAEPKTSCNFTYSTEVGNVTSLFKGTLLNEIITPEPNTTCYVLAKPKKTDADKEEPAIGFYPISLTRDKDGNNGDTSFQNGANKIYLPVETSGGQAPALMFRFGTTDVEDIVADKEAEPMIYDLMGRRVEKMVEGIYIVNGRKVVIK